MVDIRTNSMGTCGLCGYFGPGPQHDCPKALEETARLGADLTAARRELDAARARIGEQDETIAVLREWAAVNSDFRVAGVVEAEAERDALAVTLATVEAIGWRAIVERDRALAEAAHFRASAQGRPSAELHAAAVAEQRERAEKAEAALATAVEEAETWRDRWNDCDDTRLEMLDTIDDARAWAGRWKRAAKRHHRLWIDACEEVDNVNGIVRESAEQLDAAERIRAEAEAGAAAMRAAVLEPLDARLWALGSAAGAAALRELEAGRALAEAVRPALGGHYTTDLEHSEPCMDRWRRNEPGSECICAREPLRAALAAYDAVQLAKEQTT